MLKKDESYLIRPIGYVRSGLKDRHEAPRQSFEGAPQAWLEISEDFADRLDGISEGQEVIVLTWLHQARRNVLKVHPRDDPDSELSGVFSTRSPDRPNPIGLHRVKILKIENGGRLNIQALEAIDGTPLIDIKCVLGETSDQ
jgi:tRNA-Thr(GGU) m(6)t(6)A37 methyltransferase TsaA